MKMDVGFRIAFRTKSELEIMDDGFKWRKYGKKSVKNSPYPRNYYRCASGGCHVKKTVERDREDSSYVITTYNGIHNHESPCVVYYNQVPLMVPSGWTLQASNSSS
ncbi:probable WRKY transcription factor 51 [Telopea speciosissima]|uniref:probable WRKY transcription factor 51 n=1 Tax=Telopea speciosissima TaxID=54955 RepID=UPI001CC5B3F3|nr:probable WRKY transcription factor 51 [Telopea speciosissima]